MATTEEEVRRRAAERQTAIANLTPEKPGLAARFGRAVGASTKRSRERSATKRAEQAEDLRIRGLAKEERQASIRGDFRRLTEGFRAGNEGRPVDTAAFNPGEGTTDKTPRPPGASVASGSVGNLIESERDKGEAGVQFINQSVEQFAKDEPFPGAFDQAVESSSAEGRRRGFNTRQGEFPGKEFDAATAAAEGIDDFRIPAPQLPDPPPSTLANAGREAVARGGGSKVDRPPDTEGVPEGFINVIRGTRQSFLRDTGGPEFRQVPGQSLEDSEQIAARRDPAFNVVTKDDLAQQRVNNQTIQADAQRMQSIFSNGRIGFNDNQELILAVPNATGGFDEIQNFTPIVDALVDQGGNFSISRVPGEGGVFESAVVLNEDTGDTTNITNEQFLGKAFTEYNNRVRRAGKTLTQEEKLEILEEVEQVMGDLPEIESAILSGQ